MHTGLFSSIEIDDLLAHLEQEISSFQLMVLRLFEEFNVMSRLYNRLDYDIEYKARYPEVIFTALALRQYELCTSSTRAFGTSQYMTCATLIRSVFEGTLVCSYLSHNPGASSDFLTYSEVSCNPNVDWTKHGFSKTKIRKLEKKFGIRSMIRELYNGTDDLENRISTENYYQQLCNVSHPNLEPSSIFYQPGKPPSAAYSSLGLRRTATQLFGVLNGVNEIVCGGLLKDKSELEASYRRKSEMYRLHIEATAWHAENPDAQPNFTRNTKFKVAIAPDGAYLLGYPQNEEQRSATVVTIQSDVPT